MFEETLSRIAGRVEERLGLFFDGLRARPFSPLFSASIGSPLLDEVEALTLRGGKRLRAVFLVQGALLFDANAENRPAVFDAAAALELLHTYFLIHDDIMDGDELRRGGPAVHAALARKYGDQALGQALGILAGDLADALKELLLSRLDVEDARRREVARIFAEMHLDVVHGQTLDMLGNAPPIDVADHKTASYTTVGPLTAGAVLGGAERAEVERLGRIARPLGVAFQLHDDMLDLFADAQATGKPIGTDLREGKRTLLLEQGLALADDRQKKAIEAVLGRRDAGPDLVAAAREAFRECGAHDAVRTRIAEMTGEFVEGLSRSAYLEGGRRTLIELARFVVERDR